MQTRLKLDLARLALGAAARQIISAAKAEAVVVARDVEQTSRDRAPELTGELEASHKTQIATDTTDRLTVTVSAGPAINPATGEDYSIPMHEGLPPTGRPYNLGPVSSAKNTGLPHQGEGVGWKFLERALQDRGPALARRIAAAIRRITP